MVEDPEKEMTMDSIHNWIRDHLLSDERDYQSAKIAFSLGTPIGLIISESPDGVKLAFWLLFLLGVALMGPIGLMKR